MMPRPELSSQLLQTSPRHSWLLSPFGTFTVFKLCPGRSEAGAPGFALSPHQQRCTGRGFPSHLCLLPRLKPMGRRVTTPELGCVKAEDVPRVSGTRATILEPGLGSRSPGQHRRVWVPLLGGSSILLGMPPKKKHQVSAPLSRKLSPEGFITPMLLLLSPVAIPTGWGSPAGFGLASSVIRRSRRRGATGRSFIMILQDHTIPGLGEIAAGRR